MNRKEVLQVLARSKPELARRFGVVRLALFGSMAQDAAHPGSDVDIVVSFNGPATSQRYFGVQFYLEDALGCPVDLVTEKALRPELRPFIEQEAVNA
ncbi:MAG: DNA polymerase subunit beta [Desulfurivibrio sp.]|jgi:predicted nucleotidyltransferase|nr:MAG: DNA polymerase subunit beta [Desulfurivibrio sp.]